MPASTRNYPPGATRLMLIGALALIAGIGLAIGFFLPAAPGDARPSHADALPPSAPARDESPQTQASPASPASAARRFPLASLDVRDQHQSPLLASDGAARVWAVWESQSAEDERTLFLARSTDGGRTFESPQAVRRAPIHRWDAPMRGRTVKRESRMWPRVAYAGETLYVSWVEPQADDPARHTFFYAASVDGGNVFAEPIPLSTADAVRPTFASFAVSAQGQGAASWLDHRHDAQQPFAAILGRQGTEEHMIYAGPDAGGVCPCCVTATAWADDGTLLVAFRNSVEGCRDIWLSVLRPGAAEFEPPVPIARDRWKFDGCPHDGPSLAVHRGVLHVVWMDAHTGRERVYYANSPLHAWRFDPQPLDAEAPGSQGHPALAVGPEGSVHVVWDEGLEASHASGKDSTGHAGHHAPAVGGGRMIRRAVSADGGTTFQVLPPLATTPGAFQTRPAIVASDNGALHVAWRELSEQGVQVAIHTDAAAHLATESTP